MCHLSEVGLSSGVNSARDISLCSMWVSSSGNTSPKGMFGFSICATLICFVMLCTLGLVEFSSTGIWVYIACSMGG